MIFAFTMLPGVVNAQLIKHVKVVPDTYNFWVYDAAPDSTKIPCVIFLHGKSLCGNDLALVRQYGCLDALCYGIDIPAIIIAPQNPGNEWWKPSKVMKILEWAEEHYPIDTDRVYVIGMSLGGYGAMDLAASYPDKIAAAMPLCGGTTLKSVSGLGDIPTWIIHGSGDEKVPYSQSLKVYSELTSKKLLDRLRFDLIMDSSHADLARCFYMPKVYQWLFSHSLKDKGRPVNWSISITSKDLEDVPKNRGKKHVNLTVSNYEK